MTEKLKKINIYLRPEVEATARRQALATGQSLSGWFRSHITKHLDQSDALAQAAITLNAVEKDDDSEFNAETFEQELAEAQSKKRVF
jgi:hypothetical protein